METEVVSWDLKGYACYMYLQSSSLNSYFPPLFLDQMLNVLYQHHFQIRPTLLILLRERETRKQVTCLQYY